MLVLSRKSQEAIVIRDDIVVRVLEVSRDTVKLGIEAPADVPVHRVETQNAPAPPLKKRQGSFRPADRRNRGIRSSRSR